MRRSFFRCRVWLRLNCVSMYRRHLAILLSLFLSVVLAPNAFGQSSRPHDAFYHVAEVSAEPGTLIRTEDAPHLLNLVGERLPGHAYKILYSSTTVHGDPVAVSGFVIEPASQWRGKGETPTVVFGPGTRGAGDICAPSRSLGLLAAVDPHGPHVNINYEINAYYTASLLGMRVVVTDYIGLGTAGAHTYVLNDEQAHAMLDAARAVVPAGHPVGFHGYSQGGGAAAAAAEHAATYAPELNVKGTYAGAPPANLKDVMAAVDGSALTGVLGYAIAGYSARYPEFNAEMSHILNDHGRAFVADTSASCVSETALNWALTDTSTMTTSGKRLSQASFESPTVLRIFEEQQLGRRTPNAPIMIAGGDNDDIIPNDQVRQLARDYCARGASVDYLLNDTPSLTSSQPYGVDHAYGMFFGGYQSMRFLVDRFNDVPAHSICAD